MVWQGMYNTNLASKLLPDQVDFIVGTTDAPRVFSLGEALNIAAKNGTATPSLYPTPKVDTVNPKLPRPQKLPLSRKVDDGQSCGWVKVNFLGD